MLGGVVAKTITTGPTNKITMGKSNSIHLILPTIAAAFFSPERIGNTLTNISKKILFSKSYAGLLSLSIGFVRRDLIKMKSLIKNGVVLLYFKLS